MDRLKKMCTDTYEQSREKLTQPNEAYTPRELIVRMQRNQKLPSLKCNFDPEQDFPYSEKEDMNHVVLDNMEDEPEPPRDLTDLDIASRIVKDFNKEIKEEIEKHSKNKIEEESKENPQIENAPE